MDELFDRHLEEKEDNNDNDNDNSILSDADGDGDNLSTGYRYVCICISTIIHCYVTVLCVLQVPVSPDQLWLFELSLQLTVVVCCHCIACGFTAMMHMAIWKTLSITCH
jgi:hypothetical protein